MYLEVQACLDTFRDDLSERLVKVAQDLHGELRLNLVFTDEFIESIGERNANADSDSQLMALLLEIATLLYTSRSGRARRQH